MEEKVIKFDLSAERLLDLADKKLEEKDYLAALRIMRKSVEINGATPDEFSMFADIYDEMEIFEYAIDHWFRFLDICAEDEVVDAYEGLAACYYNMGSERQAAFYYNLMMHDKFVTPENNVEMGELFSEPAPKRFRIVYPPEEADYSPELEEGLRALRGGDYKKAESFFSGVPAGASCYLSARNFYALTKLMQGDASAAEQICKDGLAQAGNDVALLSTYAAVLTEQGRAEESRAAAEKLAALPVSGADDLYKIATVCCENKLYEEAYEKFSLLEKEVRFDLTLLYFKGVAAFRCGRVKDSLRTFSKLIDIYPDAAVARYYFGEIRRYAEEGGEAPETNFLYRVPAAERETRIRLLSALSEVPLAELDAFLAHADITEYLEWCFDEADGTDAELMLLALRLAVRAGEESFVRDILLRSGVGDIVKLEALRFLAERNKDLEAGVVVADIYRCASFLRLEVGRTRHAKFVAAYALAFARFCFLADEDCAAYKQAAERMYGALERAGKLTYADAPENLACAMYFMASRGSLLRTKDALEAAGGNSAAVAEILHIVNADVQREIAAGSEPEQNEKHDPDKTGEE